MTVCRKCEVELIDENWSPSRKKGNRKICKKCHVIESKESYLKNKDCVTEYQKEYAFDNKKHLTEYKHEYYLKHCGDRKGYSKGEKHYKWSGGRKIANIRKTSRHRKLGKETLNIPLECTVGHHINMDYIVYVPIWINKIPHNVRTGKNLDYVNALTLFWLCYTEEINSCKEV